MVYSPSWVGGEKGELKQFFERLLRLRKLPLNNLAGHNTYMQLFSRILWVNCIIYILCNS